MKKILFSLIIIVALFCNMNIAEAQYAHPATAIKSTNGNVQSDLNTLQSNIGASTVEVGLITAEIALIQANLSTMEASLIALALNDATQESEIANITAEIDLIQTNLGTLEDLVDSNHAWTTAEIADITAEIALIQANLGIIETRLDEHYANLETHELSINALITNDQTQETRIESTEVGLAIHENNVSNPHSVTATQVPYTDTYLMGVTTVQSAIDTLETWLGGWINDSFVYGFVEPLTATLSYDASTQTFTITGDHVIYINGKKVTKTTASKTHPATTGTHYFYYDSDGVLQTSTALWGNAFFNVAQIAYVYYNAEKVSAPQGLMFDEEHLYNMSTAMHYYLHTTRGAVSSDLFPLGNYDLAPTVPTDAGNQFSATGGTLVDEDHRETIADVPDGGYYPIFWREGVEGDWTWQSGVIPVLVGSNYPMYNQLTGGSWTTTEISANNYVNMYTAVTNAADETYSVILIMGQQVYTTLALAQAANPINTLSLGNLPFNEIIITNKITFRTGAGYGTTGKCRIESVESLAGITIRLGGAVMATSHSGLSNRTDPGSHPASAVSYVDTYDLGVTDVQSALDTIELWLSAIDVTNDSQDVAINNINSDIDSAEVAINLNNIDDDSQDVTIEANKVGVASVEVGLQMHQNDATGAHAATAISATSWDNVQTCLDSLETAIQSIVVGSGFAMESWVNSTLEANFYNAAQTNATIEAAIAAVNIKSEKLTNTGDNISFDSAYIMTTNECQIFLNGVMQWPEDDYYIDEDSGHSRIRFIAATPDASKVFATMVR